MSRLAPVAPRERVVTLDVLRGFALWGVMTGNMVLYSGRWATWHMGPSSTLDAAATWFLHIFVDSKAQTLLTFLFGFGFAIQLLRARARGEPVLGLYVRRLLALLVLGALHVTLLWWGDVTWTYAVAGFGLLPFMRASNRARVAWGLVFIFVPYLLWQIPAVNEASLRVFLEPRDFAAHTERMAAAMRAPDRAGLAWEHATYALVWCARIWIWYPLWTLGRFLLGYVAGDRRWFERDGAGHLPLFRRMAAWCGATAAATTALAILEHTGVLPVRALGLGGRLASAAVEQVGLLAMTLTYVAIVVLLMQRPRARRLLALLAPAGRMPLTTYYSQSVICTWLFYGWGLGWAGSVGVAGTVALAAAIFAIQVAICHAWLRAFRFGPLEWLWRSVVYLEPQPMLVETG